jgi:hypothetical protein
MSIGVLATNYCRAKKKPIEKKETWSCPPEGCLKINVDATFDQDIGTGNMRAIVRDLNGKCIAANYKKIYFLTDDMMVVRMTQPDTTFGISKFHNLSWHPQGFC